MTRQIAIGGPMNRRGAILALAALAAAAGPPRVFSQPPKIRRIGVLMGGTAEAHKATMGAFAKRLRELGWEPERTISIEARYADNRIDRFPPLAKELVESKVELVISSSTPGALAMKQATSSLPVVFTAVSDPVALGLVQSLARPGGNMTGLSSLVGDTAGKQFELLMALVPRLERVALMVVPGHQTNKLMIPRLETTVTNARATLVVIEVGSAQALETAFAKAVAERATAMIVPPDPLYYSLRGRIAQLALQTRIATGFTMAAFGRDGGLVSYGLNYADEFVRSADYVDKILRGARPADLPVAQADRFEMVINRATAKALGLTIPQSVLVRADEVVE